MTFYDHVVIGHQILQKQGCFSEERYWIAGWQTGLPRGIGMIRFVNGISGKETEITVQRIKPSMVFEVN